MSVVKLTLGCAAAALLAAHELSSLDPARLAALRALLGPAGIPAPATASSVASAARPAPSPAAAPSGGDEVLFPDRFGQFESAIEIEGQRISVMVDTGATFVSLGAADADRLGIHPMPSDFRVPVDTANGRISVAKVVLASVRLGGIELRNVEALVSGRGQLGRTLLGMSFLSRLSSVRVERGRMVLLR